MHFSFSSAVRSASTFAFAALLLFVFSLTANAQYFKFSGSFTYTSNYPGKQVADITPDGKMGVALTLDKNIPGGAVITTFHPLFGDRFDTKTFGFGPLEVRIAKVGNSTRAVVLTSQGGPRRVYLFDVSATGQLTEIGFTDLTTSVGDSSTNMVLSGTAGLGWVGVVPSAGNGRELVCFNLNTGAIVKRSPLAAFPESLVLNEGPGRRVLAYRGNNDLKIVNVLDAANPVETASVPLVRNAESSASFTDEIVFSNDGRYAFVANQFYNFAAIDLNTKQIVATLDSSFRFSRIESFEDNQRRLLAVLSASTGTVNSSALLLIDATNPSQLQILKNLSPAPMDRFKFSNDGSRLFAASGAGLIAFNLPDFTTIWEQFAPNPTIRANQLHVYGPENEIVGAWWYHDGTGDGALIGAFPSVAPPSVSLSDSVTVNETAGGVNASFTITLSAPTSHRVTIEYAAIDDTAKQNSDYTATTGALVLQPGTTSGNVLVPILDDSLDEAGETLKFRIAPNLGRVTHGESTVTINDNDAPPSVSVADSAGVTEGNEFTGALSSFLVTLSGPSGQTITMTYAVAPNTATTNDFFNANGTITFFPGETQHEIVLPVFPDRLSEGDETFFLNLSNATNVTVADGQGTGAILDDDAPLLATELNSQRGIALDAVTLVREPFNFTNPNYFGNDHRTRLAFFTTNLILTSGLVVTAEAVDAQQVVHQLPVEFVGIVKTFVPVVPEAPVLTQIVVRLPESLANAGDLQVRITARGRTSNTVLVAVKP